ncbi:hypothetical protein E2C01_056664 [Portunus trituberculatus]|uniref:Uncharacterized protein n=1 Tax=Portunus trituberculatus TaxID=210409 RepID=A0A5B7H079_PORTR|nr:hypothetical protein [Portunus trituberculatus]
MNTLKSFIFAAWSEKQSVGEGRFWVNSRRVLKVLGRSGMRCVERCDGREDEKCVWDCEKISSNCKNCKVSSVFSANPSQPSAAPPSPITHAHYREIQPLQSGASSSLAGVSRLQALGQHTAAPRQHETNSLFVPLP